MLVFYFVNAINEQLKHLYTPYKKGKFNSGTKHLTQLKTHIQLLPSMAGNVSNSYVCIF